MDKVLYNAVLLAGVAATTYYFHDAIKAIVKATREELNKGSSTA